MALATVLFSCAHGKTEHFPQAGDFEKSAEVIVMRDDSLYGLGFSLDVLLDNTVIAKLRSGEYVSFWVDPGVHTVGISQSLVSMAFEQGRTYYFLISADQSEFGFEIDPITEGRARERLKDLTPLK